MAPFILLSINPSDVDMRMVLKKNIYWIIICKVNQKNYYPQMIIITCKKPKASHSPNSSLEKKRSCITIYNIFVFFF